MKKPYWIIVNSDANTIKDGIFSSYEAAREYFISSGLSSEWKIEAKEQFIRDDK